MKFIGKPALALAGATIVMASSALLAPAAQADPSAVSDFGACLASERQGDLLVMIDESSSLQASDPEGARISAAEYLVEKLSSFGKSAGVDVDIAIAGFSSDFSLHSDWTPLDERSLPAIVESLGLFRDRNQGVDTDYWTALDGARRTLAGRDSARGCQAVAWFSDGKLDFTTRDATKPFAPNQSLGSDAGVAATIAAATESVCRPGGLADQLRSSGVTTFGIGLSSETAAATDFELMKSIATGSGSCGQVVTPRPGDFYLAQNIDDLLFAFDAISTPGQAPLERSGDVCRLQVCEEGKHRFVLDESIGSVEVLGYAGGEGMVPTLVAPTGDSLVMPNRPIGDSATLDFHGVDVTYAWQSPSTVSFSMKRGDTAQWRGAWALAFVDPSGRAEASRSKSNIHISGNLFPAWSGREDATIHSGEVARGIQLGIVDGERRPVDPDSLLGKVSMSVSMIESNGTTTPVAAGIPKDRIDSLVDLDLTDVPPGNATLRLTLDVTTADAVLASGAVEPGTVLTPQIVDVPLTIAPPIGYPTIPSRIDFGTVEGAGRFVTDVDVAGAGCVWMDPATPASVLAAPDGIGTVAFAADAASAGSCLAVGDEGTASLPVTLEIENPANGVVNGSVRLTVAPEGEPDRAIVVDVPVTAQVQKPVDEGRFALALLAALLLGPGIPLAILYGAKRYVSRIPARTLKGQLFPIAVVDGAVLRDGAQFQLGERDLIESVRGLAQPARRIDVDGVELRARTGWSPFGVGYVTATQPGMVGASSAELPTDKHTGGARLPLAVHNSWFVLHDPSGPPQSAVLGLLVGADASPTHRQALVDDIHRRLPAILATLRNRGIGVAGSTAGGGPEQAGAGAAASGDPFARPPGTPESGGPFHDPTPFAGGGHAGGNPFGEDPFARPGDVDPFGSPDRRG